MRALFAPAALLLWQMVAGNGGTETPAQPRYLQYQRQIVLPTRAAGQACAELDTDALAHAASRFGNDLRLFGGPEASAEVPFALTESEAQPDDGRTATVLNLGVHEGEIVFDLAMPTRPYTDVTLDLNAKNFVGTATVTGEKPGGETVQMGTFTIFDLTEQHLARSTTLPLQESTFPRLHVVLRLHSPSGGALADLTPAVVRGAAVPPSRETQTLYTTVAETKMIQTKGKRSVAVMRIPAHVPVERVVFTLDAGFHKNFLREVEITARPDAAAESAATETISGNISSETLPGSVEAGSADPNLHLSVDAALGANLRSDATVEVDVKNGDDKPLPIRSVGLAMRQRMICFNAASAQEPYTLRYGDAALPAPVYDYARLFQPASEPIDGKLGPEQPNPDWERRPDDRPYTERHPDLLWVGLLVAVSVLGGTAAESIKRRKHHQK